MTSTDDLRVSFPSKRIKEHELSFPRREVWIHQKAFKPSLVSDHLAVEAVRFETDTYGSPDGLLVGDIGSGVGVLSFPFAFLGATVCGCDINPTAVKMAEQNAIELGIKDNCSFYSGDLFAAFPSDLMNPGFDIIMGDVAGIPEVFSYAGWAPGGRKGSELPVRMLSQVSDWLKPGGRLYLPTGSIQEESAVLLAAFDAFGSHNVMQLYESVPIHQSLPRDPKVLPEVLEELEKLMESGTVRLEKKGSRVRWQFRIWVCVKA